MEQYYALAASNMQSIAETRYPGRGLVIGRTPDGRHHVQVAWLAGRSLPSRNRRYEVRDGRVVVVPVRATVPHADPLRHYAAMAEYQSVFFVSNGDHTECLVQNLAAAGQSFQNALRQRSYEEDQFGTARIAAFTNSGRGVVAGGIGILRKSAFDDSCERGFYQYAQMQPGFGYCIYTYGGARDPLYAHYKPSADLAPYRGEPLFVSVPSNSIEKVAEAWHSVVHGATRVATAVKFIDVVTGASVVHIINEH